MWPALAGAGEVEAVGEGVDSLKVHVPGIMIKSWHVPYILCAAVVQR